jgi:ubiquinone/menaquinone biosynthesis C-methylase UbiE
MSVALTRIRAEYNRIAPLFSLGSALIFPHRAHLIAREVLPRLGLQGGETVLDVGCGTGHNFLYLLNAIGPRGRLIGVDLAEGMLIRARRRIESHGWKNVQLVLGNAGDLGFLRPHSIDVVFCSLSLSLLPDRTQALDTMADVLTRHGRVAVIEWKPFSGWWRLANPLVYLSMSALPSTNAVIFNRAAESATLIRQLFPEAEYHEYFGGSLYLVVARADDATAGRPEPC